MAHILIVEDEARIADFVDRGLRAAGHVTSQASDGHTGLHLALGGDVDLVVLDLGLPDRDGLDVLARPVPEHVLEQDPERVGEARDVPLRLERVEPVDLDGAVADGEGGAR